MDTTERIEELFKHYSMSAKKFAETIGIKSPQTFYDIQKGKIKNISNSLAGKITDKYPEVNKEWLLTGSGVMINQSKISTAKIKEIPFDKSGEYFTENSTGSKFYDLGNGKYRMTAPLVPYCAYGRFANEADTLEVDKEDWGTVSFEVSQIALGKYLAFEVKGDSMDDGSRSSFEEGDMVLARELSRIHWKDGLRYNKYPYWVIVFDSSVLIKEIINQDMETGEITCHSLNPSRQYTDFKISLDEVRALYNVVKKKPREVDF